MSVFGYINDKDESLRSKSGGKFGLNQGFITKLEYNPNAGKDGTPADAVDITAFIGDKEYRLRIYDVTGALYKGGTLIEPNEEGYQGVYETEMKQRLAVITHAVKALGVTDEQLKQALTPAPNSFKDWAKTVTSLIGNDYQNKPVDIFLEYQWSIKEGNDRTYLQLPTNMKGGYFLVPSVKPVGKWTAVINEDGLKYVDDAGNEHPFYRNANYMNSPKANQQIEGEDNTNSEINSETADKATW